jgi:hypothetical protein
MRAAPREPPSHRFVVLLLLLNGTHNQVCPPSVKCDLIEDLGVFSATFPVDSAPKRIVEVNLVLKSQLIDDHPNEIHQIFDHMLSWPGIFVIFVI